MLFQQENLGACDFILMNLNSTLFWVMELRQWPGGVDRQGLAHEGPKIEFEAPSEKMELKIAPGFEAEMEAVVGGLIQLYIKQILDVLLRLMEIRK